MIRSILSRVTLCIGILFATATLAAAQEAATGKVFWRGTVDNKVHLVITGDTLEVRTVEGRETGAGTHSFTSPLPMRPVTVSVLRKSGRSKKITVVQQPTEENNFSAIVEIHDDGGGARDYQVEIFWR